MAAVGQTRRLPARAPPEERTHHRHGAARPRSRIHGFYFYTRSPPTPASPPSTRPASPDFRRGRPIDLKPFGTSLRTYSGPVHSEVGRPRAPARRRRGRGPQRRRKLPRRRRRASPTPFRRRSLGQTGSLPGGTPLVAAW
ncbi:pr6 [rat cytomegalovirus strain Maastricht]|uniref:Pr6 n=1 Tax=Rat cytomegalovirus (strain Maastricht) TaxID=79700 RepID=Q9DWH1_RCMVM|nr:pr6 [rat cytomegalovirus strain Maastricht]AAF99118.1 pr6 [rat cytomegalovirus strain Maastricht]